ncbi:MAG: molybdopterin-guanine dinucleotide biosynthesis protein B [Proteobacteria bacterium]|nr:molybdopterin-guanine dinucleotide biosynthesis protein B [Pseudomonadota bacterium]MBU1708992.1 molybdopterin-guanine dinucleotide biosynthesis protein B [Pseudomonadota bacterium]
MPPIVSFIGRPDSGKTTLLEKIIPMLITFGYRVGIIKHHVHAFEMDKPGKDTWRLKQAGARTVALSSPAAIGVISDTGRDLAPEEIAETYFKDVDIVLTEGYKQGNARKIEVFRRDLYDEPLPGRDSTWLAFISNDPIPGEMLPVFNPEDISGLADFLVKHIISPD